MIIKGDISVTSSLQHLIQKYDTSGPRYTSYPPAPVFTSQFGAGNFLEEVRKAESHPRNAEVSLYVHVPFCDTLCYFCGCTTIITRSRERMHDYVGYLKKEIDLLFPLLHRSRKIVQMHWGGGTPTYLSPAEIVDLGNHLQRSFVFSDDPEISVELDPRDLTIHHMRALRDTGFNRVSIGVQDFDAKVQRAVNRNQSEFITRQAIDWSRALGFQSINLDLIYGLPLQTLESFSETLEKVIAISPERIAVYNFAYVPWMKKHHSIIHPEDLPAPEVKIAILLHTIERFTEAGYVYIGMDHFAKPGDELAIAQQRRTLQRNFQGYSTHGGADLYAFGMSAISHFAGTYAQNIKTLLEYQTAIERGRFATHAGYVMTSDDRLRKAVIMRLMCHMVLDKNEIEKEFHVEFDSYFADSLKKLDPLVEDGLVNASSREIRITSSGRLFLRNIAMCFDAYHATQQHRPLYSKTV